MSRCVLPHEIHVPTWIDASELKPHCDRFIRDLLEQGAYSEPCRPPIPTQAGHPSEPCRPPILRT